MIYRQGWGLAIISRNINIKLVIDTMIKGSLGGETSVLRTFRMSGKKLVKDRVSEGKSSLGKELIVTFRLSGKELVKGRVS